MKFTVQHKVLTDLKFVKPKYFTIFDRKRKVSSLKYFSMEILTCFSKIPAQAQVLCPTNSQVNFSKNIKRGTWANVLTYTIGSLPAVLPKLLLMAK